ncbi:AAA family ATPase, partial [Mycobacterium avium]
VILVVTEDDWQTTVLPRLEVAGVDLAMVSVICAERDGSGAPVFPRDLPLIRNADPAPALVAVDAWLDTVPSQLSVRDPQQARQALHPWKEVATTTGAAVLLLCHTNRVATANARDKYGATGELRKKARMTLFAQTDDDGHLVVGPE